MIYTYLGYMYTCVIACLQTKIFLYTFLHGHTYLQRQFGANNLQCFAPGPFFQRWRPSMSLTTVHFLLAGGVGAFWLTVPVSLPEVGHWAPGLGRFPARPQTVWGSGRIMYDNV
jgi:hypothetical protein